MDAVRTYESNVSMVVLVLIGSIVVYVLLSLLRVIRVLVTLYGW